MTSDAVTSSDTSSDTSSSLHSSSTAGVASLHDDDCSENRTAAHPPGWRRGRPVTRRRRCRRSAPPIRVPDFSLSLERPWRRNSGSRPSRASSTSIAPRRSKQRSRRRSELSGDPRDGKPCRLVVDLRSVTFVDSTMLGLLLAASRREQARGAELRILVGPETPMTAFVVTGVDRLLAISRGRQRPQTHDGLPRHARSMRPTGASAQSPRISG